MKEWVKEHRNELIKNAIVFALILGGGYIGTKKLKGTSFTFTPKARLAGGIGYGAGAAPGIEVPKGTLLNISLFEKGKNFYPPFMKRVAFHGAELTYNIDKETLAHMLKYVVEAHPEELKDILKDLNVDCLMEVGTF